MNGGGSNLTFANNLVVSVYTTSPSTAFHFSNGCGSNITITDTIADSSGTGAVCGALSKNDYWDGASIPSGDIGSIVANPLFKHPSAMDYSLLTGSPGFGLGYQELPWSQMGVQ